MQRKLVCLGVGRYRGFIFGALGVAFDVVCGRVAFVGGKGGGGGRWGSK